MSKYAPCRVLYGYVLAGLLAACGSTGDSARLTPDDPVLVVDKSLRVELTADEAGRVDVTRLQRDAPETPAGTESLGTIYAVEADTAVRLVMAAPDSPAADILRWDDAAQDWDFVPLVERASNEWVVEGAGTVGLFAVVDRTPIIATIIDADMAGRANKTGALRMILLESVISRADGSLDVKGLAALSGEGDYLTLPSVTIDGPDLASLLASDAAQKTHIAGLRQVAADADGAAVVYGPVNTGQSGTLHAMIEAAGMALREDDKLLVVRLPAPETAEGDWRVGGYDVVRVGEAANWVIVDLPGGPGDLHDGGMVADYLDWLVRRIDRRKIIPAFAVTSAEEWEGTTTLIPYDYALAPLGSAGLQLNQPGAHLEPGTALTFRLVGQASNFILDPATGLYQYDVFAAGGEHRIWLMTASALRQRLDWLASYGVGGVLAEGLLDIEASPGTLAAVERFSVGQDAAGDEPLIIVWEVQDDGGQVLFSERTALDEPLIWTPSLRGDYQVSATIGGSSELAIGDISIEVGAPPPTPTQTPVQVVAGGQTGQAGGVGSPTGQNFTVLEGMPDPIFPPGQASFGKFELGGQVNHQIRHPGMMSDSGMTWVKFQLTWQPGLDPSSAWELVERGREAGFKVLLSIVGSEKRPQSINVPSYLDFLRGVAYYGPEAIEVWNEPNYYFEWPQGQMNGGEYVRRMLAPAYNAIKSVNSNIMVVSGAPLPTGAYFGEGGCSSQGYGCDDWLYIQQMAEAGASNYMDCVGVHYNAGATAPSATTGHPGDPGYQHYSWYFGGMLQLYAGTFGHPVCFTELGYVSKDGLGELPGNFSWASNTTVSDQAAWLAEAAQLSRESGQVRLMVVWNVDFVYWGSDDPKAGYAIVRPGGSCPACTTLGQVMP